jgi:hypothetical protein
MAIQKSRTPINKGTKYNDTKTSTDTLKKRTKPNIILPKNFNFSVNLQGKKESLKDFGFINAYMFSYDRDIAGVE